MPESTFLLTLGVLFLYLGYLVLPGYAALCLAGVSRNRFLLGYGISFSLLVFTQIPMKVLGGSVMLWYWIVHLAIAILLGTSWFFGRHNRIRAVWNRNVGRWTAQAVGFSTVVIGFSIYHLKVGAYTEIPSDFWVHLGDVWSELVNIKKNVLPGLGLDIGEIVNGNYVPFLHAVSASLLQSNPLWLVPGATLATSIIFKFMTSAKIYGKISSIISNGCWC